MTVSVKEYMRQKWEDEHPRAREDRLKWEKEVEEKRIRKQARMARTQSQIDSLNNLKDFEAKQRAQKRLDRFKGLSSDFSTGMSLEDVCKKYNISRERVRQLLRLAGDEEYKLLKQASRDKRPKKTRLVKMICQVCGKEFETQEHKIGKQKFCSLKCSGISRIKYPELRESYLGDKRKYWNEKTKRFYHKVLKHNPEWRKKMNERNREYAKNSGYYQRPEVKKRTSEYHKIHWKKKIQEIRNDPVKYQAYREKERARGRKYYQLHLKKT